MKSIVAALILVFTFNSAIMSQKPAQEASEKEYMVVIHTDMGDITVKLYNETPLHRDNFIKLVNEGYYDGSIFHRVIREFMIQGGGGKTGNEDPGYKIPAEIIPGLYHKKGALAAARMGDHVNPRKESSGSQFYIVHGRKFAQNEMEMHAQRSGKKWSEEQIETYAKIGGAPHLDGDYTVFGEVVSGLDVVDRIAAVQTGAADRPVSEVKMRMSLLK